MSIEIQNAVEDAILSQGTWETWEPSAWSRNLSVTTPYGTVTVDEDGSKTERSDLDSYGEYEQGSEEEVFIIFQVDDPPRGILFFKKFGVSDSYGRTNWNGKFRQVFPKVKTVTVYDYE